MELGMVAVRKTHQSLFVESCIKLSASKYLTCAKLYSDQVPLNARS